MNYKPYKFRTKEEYYEWCDTIITRIYYGAIAMNNEGIKDQVEEIMKTLHISEGDYLIAEPEDLEYYESR